MSGGLRESLLKDSLKYIVVIYSATQKHPIPNGVCVLRRGLARWLRKTIHVYITFGYDVFCDIRPEQLIHSFTVGNKDSSLLTLM